MPGTLVPQPDGEPIVLDKAITVLGRHPDCEGVITQSRKVSRQHCCIAQINGRFRIRDLASTNGVRVNGKIIRECEINDGDIILVGDVSFILQCERKETPPKKVKNVFSPASRPPVDLSMEYPVPIEEDEEDEIPSLRLREISDSRVR